MARSMRREDGYSVRAPLKWTPPGKRLCRSRGQRGLRPLKVYGN